MKKTTLKPPATPKVRIPQPEQLVVPIANAPTAADQDYQKEIDAHMKRMHV